MQLLGSGTIFREVIAAAELLKAEWGVESDLWACPSFTELAREGMACSRAAMLSPLAPAPVCHVQRCLGETKGPVVAATDYMRAFAEQIRPYVPRRYVVLGTDGFGRSDFRRKLRAHFEVDRHYVAVASLKALADENKIPSIKVAEAIKKYGIDPHKPSPAYS